MHRLRIGQLVQLKFTYVSESSGVSIRHGSIGTVYDTTDSFALITLNKRGHAYSVWVNRAILIPLEGANYA